MLRDRIIIGIADNQIRARLLRESRLILQKALEICQSSEQVNLHLQQMDLTPETTHYLKTKSKRGMTKKKSEKTALIRNCLFCGTSHNRGKHMESPVPNATRKITWQNSVEQAKMKEQVRDTNRNRKQSCGNKTRVHEVQEYQSDDSMYSVCLVLLTGDNTSLC